MWHNEDEPTTSVTNEEVERLLEEGHLSRGLRRADRVVNWLFVAAAVAALVVGVVWGTRP